MNITFEMIEKVIDATGADYYTVKKALLDNDGDVEKAIRFIEQMNTEEKEDHSDGTPEDAVGETEKSEEAAESEETGADEDNQEEKDPFKKCFSEEQAEQMLNRIKEKVEAGYVDRIKITKDDKVLLDIPVNVGIISGLLGLLIVPWAVILGILIAYGTECKIEIIKPDGTSEKL